MSKQIWIMISLGLVLCLAGCGWEPPTLSEEPKTSHQPGETNTAQSSEHVIPVPSVEKNVPIKRMAKTQQPTPEGELRPSGTDTTADVLRLGSHVLQSSFVQRVGQDIVPGGTSTSAVRTVDGIYVGGYFSGTIEIQGKKLTSSGGEDGFVAKFDLQGTLQWAVALGGKGDDRVLDITSGCRNQLYVVGQFAQEMALGRTTLKTDATSDGFVAELFQTGQFVQVKAAGFKDVGNFHRIAVSRDTCDVFLAQMYQSQISVVSWSQNQWGTPQWTLPIQTSGSSGLVDLQIDTTGHLVILGSFFRWGGIGPKHSFSGYGMYAACLHVSGEVKWVFPIQTHNQQATSQFRIAINGALDRVVIAGAVLSNLVIDGKTFSGQVFVAAFNLQGKNQWVASLPETTVPEGIVLEQDHTYLLGRSSQPVKLGNDHLQLPSGHTSARFIASLDQRGAFVKARVVMSHESLENNQQPGVVMFTKEQDEEFLVSGNFGGEIESGNLAAYDKTHAFFLLKTTTQGTTRWLQASGNGNGEVWVRDAAVDKQGHVYRVISFAGKIVVGTQSFDSKGRWTHALLKQEQQGKLLWVQWFRALPVSTYSPVRLTLGADGSAAVAGVFSGCAQFGETSLCSPINNGYVARWSTDGKFLAARLLRDSRRIQEGPIQSIDDIVLAPNGTMTIAYRESIQAYLSQWSKELALIQELPFGGNSPHPANRTALAVDAQSQVYLLGGAYAPNLQFGHISLQTQRDKNWNGTISGFVAKLDVRGQFVWAKSSWDELPYTGRTILADANGNLTITGAFRGTARLGKYEFTSGKYDTDGFVAQLDTHGQVTWALSFHTADAYSQPNDYYYYRDESGLSLTKDTRGHTYLLGSFYRGVQIGKFALEAKQRGAQFIAKLSPSGEVLWAEATNASVARLYTNGSHLLLFGQISHPVFSFRGQTFNLPNNNTDYYARLLLDPRP